MRETLREIWACLHLLWWLTCGARSWPVGVVLVLAVAGLAYAAHPLGGLGLGLPGPIHRPGTAQSAEMMTWGTDIPVWGTDIPTWE